MDTETRNALLPLTLLASASGARTWAGIAALEPRTVVPVFAAAELVLDKLPFMQLTSSANHRQQQRRGMLLIMEHGVGSLFHSSRVRLLFASV